MPLERLKKHLDDNKIKYVIKSHSVAYTTPEIAAMAHIPGKEWAKTVIIKIDLRVQPLHHLKLKISGYAGYGVLYCWITGI